MPDFYLQTHDCRITARSKTSQLSGWRVMLQTRCRELFLVMRSKGSDLVTRHVAGRPLPFGCSQSPSTFTRSLQTPDPRAILATCRAWIYFVCDWTIAKPQFEPAQARSDPGLPLSRRSEP